MNEVGRWKDGYLTLQLAQLESLVGPNLLLHRAIGWSSCVLLLQFLLNFLMHLMLWGPLETVALMVIFTFHL